MKNTRYGPPRYAVSPPSCLFVSSVPILYFIKHFICAKDQLSQVQQVKLYFFMFSAGCLQAFPESNLLLRSFWMPFWLLLIFTRPWTLPHIWRKLQI